MAVAGLLLLIGAVLATVTVALIVDFASKAQAYWASQDDVEKTQPPGTHRILTRLLGLISSSTEEQENIVGDLFEEFNEFPSRLSAYLWLYKQVLRSAPNLIYKTAKSRLASYFGERVR